MQIKLSKIAKESLTEQIEFLEKIWTHREVVIFLEDVKKVSNDLKKWKI